MTTTHILQDADLPFSDRLSLREHILAWISRDVGLHNFFFPPGSAHPLDLTPQQRETFTTHVFKSYLTAPSTDGNSAVARTLIRQNVAHIRHASMQLRRDQASYRHISRYALLLEALWDDVNTDMADGKWALCSMHFDTAVIALRIVYLLLYLRQKVPPKTHSLRIRLATFRRLVQMWFELEAPTDRPLTDVHTSNFRDLVSAWRKEFDTYEDDADFFEERLPRLEKYHGPQCCADILDQFLREAGVDDGWLLDARQLKADFDAGMLARRRGRRRTIVSPVKTVEDVDDEEPSADTDILSKSGNGDGDDVGDDDRGRGGGSSSSRRGGNMDTDWNADDDDGVESDDSNDSDYSRRGRGGGGGRGRSSGSGRMGRQRGSSSMAGAAQQESTRRSPRIARATGRSVLGVRTRVSKLRFEGGDGEIGVNRGRRARGTRGEGDSSGVRVLFDEGNLDEVHVDADEEEDVGNRDNNGEGQEGGDVMEVDEDELQILPPKQKRRGRPRGSKNKKTLVKERVATGEMAKSGSNVRPGRPRRGRPPKNAQVQEEETVGDEERVMKALDDATMQLEGPAMQDLY